MPPFPVCVCACAHMQAHAHAPTHMSTEVSLRCRSSDAAQAVLDDKVFFRTLGFMDWVKLADGRVTGIHQSVSAVLGSYACIYCAELFIWILRTELRP